MAIKRMGKIPVFANYHSYREYWWQHIDREGFNPHASEFVVGGEVWPLKAMETVLVPKKNLFFKDEWHCGSVQKARQVAHEITAYDDVVYLALKGKWVWVEWDHHLKVHWLPGQTLDDRSKYKGR